MALTFDSKTMMPVIGVLRKYNTLVLSLLIFNENIKNMISRCLVQLFIVSLTNIYVASSRFRSSVLGQRPNFGQYFHFCGPFIYVCTDKTHIKGIPIPI